MGDGQNDDGTVLLPLRKQRVSSTSVYMPERSNRLNRSQARQISRQGPDHELAPGLVVSGVVVEGCGGEMVTRRSAKPPCEGSIPSRTSILLRFVGRRPAANGPSSWVRTVRRITWNL